MFSSEMCSRCLVRPFVVQFTALHVSEIDVDASVGLCAECLDELDEMRRDVALIPRDQALLQVAQIASTFPGAVAAFSSDAPAHAVMQVTLSDGNHLTIMQEGDLRALWRAAQDIMLKRQRETRK